jgi:hypothetical protein
MRLWLGTWLYNVGEDRQFDPKSLVVWLCGRGIAVLHWLGLPQEFIH